MPSVDTYRRPLKSVGRGAGKKTGKALDTQRSADILCAMFFAKACEKQGDIGM